MLIHIFCLIKKVMIDFKLTDWIDFGKKFGSFY